MCFEFNIVVKEKDMEIRDLLPIGSVVLLNGGKKKLMVIGVKQKKQDTNTEYDYSGVLYPEGSIGNMGQFLFNHNDIAEIIFEGYRSEERDEFINKLAGFYENKNR